MSWERADRAERPGFTERDLKVCELCGALNMASSRECVVCSWRGRFDFDPETIRKAMEELSSASANEAESYFSTNQALDEYLSPESHPPNRLVAWLRRKLGL